MLFEGKAALALWAMTDLLCGSWVKREMKLPSCRAPKVIDLKNLLCGH